MTIDKIRSQIIGAPNLNEFAATIKAVDQETLIVFDIDEVIFTATDQVLHPNYRHYRDKFEEELTQNFDQATVTHLSSIMYKTRKCALVDTNILKIFDIIATNKLRAIALTHAPSGKLGVIDQYEILRIEQLKSVNVDFTKSAQYFADTSFPDLESEDGIPLLYKGVICTSYVDKGTVLGKFLATLAYTPSKIIFIDDRMDNLISVKSLCIHLGIAFTGFEYTAVKDSKSAPFNEMRAKLQFKTLALEKIWLNDHEADLRLKSNV